MMIISWIMVLLLFFLFLLDILVGLILLHLNKKIQKMNRHLLGKNLGVFPQKLKFFLNILMIILKIDVTIKLFLVMQFSIIV